MAKSGDTLRGRYELRASFGRGGLGEVFLGVDTRTQREVSVKVFEGARCPQPARLRYQGLVAAAVGVNHAAVALPFQVDLLGEPPLAVGEVLAGMDLDALLRGGRLPWLRAVEIAQACADALVALAEVTDVAHRALKPGNVWICPDGQVRVLDFGVAELGVCPVPVRADGTAVEYRAPEQIEGHIGDSQSDVFTIGVLLFEMITGIHPFAAASPEDAAVNVRSSLPWSASRAVPSAGLPVALDVLISSMLAREPNERPTGAEALGRQLKLARRAVEVVARPPMPRPQPQPSQPRDELSTGLFLPIVRPPRSTAPATEMLPPAHPTPSPEPERTPRSNTPPPRITGPVQPVPPPVMPRFTTLDDRTEVLPPCPSRSAAPATEALPPAKPTPPPEPERAPVRLVRIPAMPKSTTLDDRTEVLPQVPLPTRDIPERTEVVPIGPARHAREAPPADAGPGPVTPPMVRRPVLSSVSAVEPRTEVVLRPAPRPPMNDSILEVRTELVVREPRPPLNDPTMELPSEAVPGEGQALNPNPASPVVAPRLRAVTILVAFNALLMIALLTLLAWLAIA